VIILTSGWHLRFGSSAANSSAAISTASMSAVWLMQRHGSKWKT
jgi:hypothetical protein